MTTDSKICTRDVINLFRYFAVTYLAKWSSPMEGMEAQALELWYRELSGFTQQQLARGLERCRHEEWPPSLPQFRRWCLDVPGLEEITRQVLHGDASHPVAQIVRQRISSWNLARDPEEENRRRVRGFYRDAVEKYVDEAASLPSLANHGEDMLAIASGDVQDEAADIAKMMRIGN